MFKLFGLTWVPLNPPSLCLVQMSKYFFHLCICLLLEAAFACFLLVLAGTNWQLFNHKQVRTANYCKAVDAIIAIPSIIIASTAPLHNCSISGINTFYLVAHITTICCANLYFGVLFHVKLVDHSSHNFFCMKCLPSPKYHHPVSLLWGSFKIFSINPPYLLPCIWALLPCIWVLLPCIWVLMICICVYFHIYCDVSGFLCFVSVCIFIFAAMYLGFAGM